VSQEFDVPGVIEVRRNDVFHKEFLLNIKAVFSRMTSKTGDLNDIYQRKHFIGLCSLYVFYFILFNEPSDKKVRPLLSLSHSLPVVLTIAPLPSSSSCSSPCGTCTRLSR